MQPFQKVAEQTRERQKKPLELLGKGASLALTGGGYASAGAMLGRILPFLSGGITAESAIHGLSKINPKFGKFINDSLKAGKSFDEVKDFIKSKVELAEESQPKSLFRRLAGDIDVTQLDEKTTKELSFLENIASQLESKGYDEKHPAVKKLKMKINKALKGLTGMVESEAMRMEPEMQQEGMMGQTQQQQPPLKIGTRFLNRNGEEAILTKLDNKTFEYRTQKGVRSGPLSSLKNEIQQIIEDQAPEQQQPQQQVGPGQQALMAILQKIQTTRGM